MTDDIEEYSDERLEQEIKKFDDELRKRKREFEIEKPLLSAVEKLAHQKAIVELEDRLKELQNEKHRRALAT